MRERVFVRVAADLFQISSWLTVSHDFPFHIIISPLGTEIDPSTVIHNATLKTVVVSTSGIVHNFDMGYTTRVSVSIVGGGTVKTR